MKETYRHEFNCWQRALAKVTGMWRINTDSVDFKWGYFAPRRGFEFVLNRGTYFNQNYALSFCFVWGHFQIKLPFKTTLSGGCNMPRYGMAIHDNTFWIYTGGNYDSSMGQVTSGEWITWHIPFFSREFKSHEILDTQDKWITMGKGFNEKPESFEFREDGAKIWQFDYTYEDQQAIAKCVMERRTWYRKWLPFMKETRTTLDVQFNREMGSQAGTWKGGVIGTSIEMTSGETAEQALRRLESTKEFR